jgi:hypothetical protein
MHLYKTPGTGGLLADEVEPLSLNQEEDQSASADKNET